MRRIVAVMVAVLVLWASAARAGVIEKNILETPDAFGDQVIYYYDARADFTTFITLRNGSETELAIDVLFYGPTFGTPFKKTVTLTPGVLTTIDVGGLRGTGLPAQAGVAIATPVDLLGRPIATSALTGNFTVANLLTGSAFGASGACRSALNNDGNPLSFGDVIGPGTATLQRILPRGVLLAAYYDPNTLAPVSQSGNQLIFINFVDEYGPAYNAVSGTTVWNVFASRASGARLPDTTFTAEGVTVTDLASVAGTDVNGAAGGISFFSESETIGVNHLVYFAESLGTFGTGYLLPPLKLRPLPN